MRSLGVELVTDHAQGSFPVVEGLLIAKMGAVSFMFDHVALIVRPKVGSEEEIVEAAIDAGAEDGSSTEDRHEVTTSLSDLRGVAQTLEGRFGEPRKAPLVWKPQTTVAVDDEAGEKVLKLVDVLEDNDDVQTVYANFEISETFMAKLGCQLPNVIFLEQRRVDRRDINRKLINSCRRPYPESTSLRDIRHTEKIRPMWNFM